MTVKKSFGCAITDATCANSEAHKRLLSLYQNVLTLYSTRKFGLMGGALPFQERHTGYLDLLSAADVVSGTINQYLTERDRVGEENACVKEGADKVLLWLGHDGLALKKLNMLMRLGDDGTLCSGIMEFSPKKIPNDKTFLPIHLCR